MDNFEYKVLSNKVHGMLQEDWFDGDENLGKEVDAAMLNGYGVAGWELCATMQMSTGSTHKLILKRRVAT